MNLPVILILLALLSIGGSIAFMSVKNAPAQPAASIQPTAKPSPLSSSSNQGTHLTMTTLPIQETITSGSCTNGKVAVDFLLDFSESMSCPNSHGNACKVDSLKQAINDAMTSFPKTNLIGAQTLENNLVSIDTFENNSDFANKVSSHKLEGGTPTEKGLNLSLQELTAAKAKFTDFTSWNLIVLTDGCPNGGQKPLIPAQAIRNMGINIYTVGIELGTAGKCEDSGGVEGAQQLMADIAGSQDRSFATDADQLSSITNEILQNICK